MKTSKLLLTTAIIASLGTTAFAADTTNQVSGNLNQVEGENNIVLGNSNNVAGYSSVTIGNHVYSHARTYNEEETSGIYSFSPNNKGNIAIGDHTKVDVRAGTAIGYLAQSFGDASVAIGAYSMAYDDVHKVDSKYAGVKTNQGVFSIGSSYAPFYDKGTTPEAKFRVFTRQLQNVGAGEISAKSTDAVNGSQLYHVMMEAQKHTVVQSGDDNIVVDGEDGFYTVSMNKDLNLNSVNLNDGNNESHYTTEGISMVHRGDGTEPVYNTTYNYNGIRIATNDGNARPIDEITLTADGLNNGGKKITNVSRGEKDTDAVNVKQLKSYVNENKTYVKASDNIEVAEDNGTFTVSTSKDLRDLNSVNLNDGNSQSSYTTEGINMTYRGTDREYHTSFKYDGMRIRTNDGDANPIDEISLTDKGLNNGGKRIINVDKGINGTDAVNVNQLRETEKNINDRINNTSNAATARANHYTDLQTAKVGARAAAMANLHYQDFNADDKWSFAAGYGHYKGANAGALGVAYQPNENTMVTVSSTIGSEPMVGAGVSMKFGKSSRMNANKQVAMAKEIEELRTIVAAQNAKIDALIDHAMGRNEAITDVVFPDVPENHWAYMMVQDLAYKGIVVGYPDTNFNGDLTLTRYEFAVALDRAITAGYMHPEMGRAIKEFKVELDTVRSGMHFRVDRLSGKDGAVNKVERVRVNKDNTRDNYGTIVK